MNILWLIALYITFASRGCNGQLSASQKQALLDIHNDWRRTTAKGLTITKDGRKQPSAADMTEMVYGSLK